MCGTVIPPNTADLGAGEKPAVFRNGGIGKEHNLKKPYLGLEMGGGTLGFGRRAILGGATVCAPYVCGMCPVHVCSMRVMYGIWYLCLLSQSHLPHLHSPPLLQISPSISLPETCFSCQTTKSYDNLK